MEHYIGVGFIVLCLAILVFVCGLVHYNLRVSKKELDVATTTASSDELEDRA